MHDVGFYVASRLLTHLAPAAGYQQHPSPELKLPEGPDTPNFWAYQSTWVDLQSLEPVLTKALEAVGAQPRGHRRSRRER